MIAIVISSLVLLLMVGICIALFDLFGRFDDLDKKFNQILIRSDKSNMLEQSTQRELAELWKLLAEIDLRIPKR